MPTKISLVIGDSWWLAWASFPIFLNCFNEKYSIEQFIEKDFIVLEPNYRGSSSHGTS